MRRRTKEDKVIDLLEEILNDHHFHPSLMANMIVTSYPPYTLNKLIELMKHIYTYNKLHNALDENIAAGRYKNDNIPVTNQLDTSWVHEEYHGQSAHIKVQANI